MDIIIEMSKCLLLSRKTIADSLLRLDSVLASISGLKGQNPLSNNAEIVVGYLYKTVHKCRYLVAIFFKVDLYISSVNNVVLGFVSKVTDIRFLGEVIQNLDISTMTEIRKDPNLVNWFFYKRTMYLSSFLERNIKEPFRFKLEDSFMGMTRKRISNWVQKIDENLAKAYLICKLCGQGILLKYIGAHSNLCFSSYELREKAERINKELKQICLEINKEIRKTRFSIISQVRRYQRKKTQTDIPKTPQSLFAVLMPPISLSRIIRDEFSNKSFNIIWFPEENVNENEALKRINAQQSYIQKPSKFFKETDLKGGIVLPISSMTLKFKEARVNLFETFNSLEIDTPTLLKSKTNPPELNEEEGQSKMEDSMIVDHNMGKSDHSDLQTQSSFSFKLPMFKPDLTKESKALYMRSVSPSPSERHVYSVSSLNNYSLTSRTVKEFQEANFEEFKNKKKVKWAGIRTLKKKQKNLSRISLILKKSSELLLEDCKLKEKLKKWMVLVNNLYREDLGLNITRIKEIMEEKIWILNKFEDIFQFGQSAIGKKRKMKSEVFEDRADIVEEEHQFYGSGKMRIKSLRHNISMVMRRIIDIAKPVVKNHQKIVEVVEKKSDPSSFQQNITKYLLNEFSNLPNTTSSVKFDVSEIVKRSLVRTSADLWKKSILRTSILGTLKEVPSILKNEKESEFENDNHKFYFSEDELQEREGWDDFKADKLDDIESYNFIRILGKGAYGVVWLVRRRLTGDLYAMKLSDFNVIACKTRLKKT